MEESKVLLNTGLSDIKLLKAGKVRDIYDLGDELLIVATDRISAFDVILPDGIPGKGKILTKLSEFWFNFTSNIIGNHLIATDPAFFPEELRGYASILKGRSMLVRRVETVPVECVVRGYLAGSGWKEYQEKGSICGIKLPSGLREAEKLPQPIFTPATKATSGHDINITEGEMVELVGAKVAEEVKKKSLRIYKVANEYARSRGLIISDTKFEFGFIGEELILIDEILTPDSSRFWDKNNYCVGRAPKNFDKQFVRDYLETVDWDKTSPAPSLPQDIIRKTSEKYREAYRRLTDTVIA
ncbi:phosphoribosylaminoimidazolesuccinocarboxamide synthase [candidate division NPL-UPA2 bacterium]|nr:phosphoribosylaminoimidazolesuccinocarboxamide synthase [candidate division NPL-UPA2 bacterium]